MNYSFLNCSGSVEPFILSVEVVPAEPPIEALRTE